MTKSEDAAAVDAVGSQVDCQVRPCAWMLQHKDGHWNTLHADALAKQWKWVQEHWRAGEPLYDQAALSAAVAAERERWELHLSATRKLAEANSKRGDDCGMLARTLLDTLKAMRA